MKLICVAGFLLIFAELSFANSFQDDSHYVGLGPRTGYYVVRDGSRLSHQLGVDDGPYVDTADPLRHGYGADVLAFRFNQAGRLIAAPVYIANAQLNEFYTRRIGSLIRGRTTVRDVQTLFGHAQSISRRPDGFVYYYTLDVFNPFEQFGGGRRSDRQQQYASDLLDSGKLEFGTGGFPECHVVTRNCELINRLLERCLNLYSAAVPETVSASRAADRDQPVVGEFPNDRVWIGRGLPFTDNLSRRTAASDEDRPQNCAD